LAGYSNCNNKNYKTFKRIKKNWKLLFN
jgi:hypothetical protein